MATVSLLRGRLIPHRTRAQGLVQRATLLRYASQGEAPAATQHDALLARGSQGDSARRQRQLLEASWTWLNL